jgi:hypothetical protein
MEIFARYGMALCYPTIEELTAAVEREARKRPEVLRLMTHPALIRSLLGTRRLAFGTVLASSLRQKQQKYMIRY